MNADGLNELDVMRTRRQRKERKPRTVPPPKGQDSAKAADDGSSSTSPDPNTRQGGEQAAAAATGRDERPPAGRTQPRKAAPARPPVDPAAAASAVKLATDAGLSYAVAERKARERLSRWVQQITTAKNAGASVDQLRTVLDATAARAGLTRADLPADVRKLVK